MKKHTRVFMALTSALLVAGNTLALTSCNKDSVSGITTGNVSAAAYNGEKITISFYHCMGSALKSILTSCIADFNKMYPNITIQETSFGDYPGVRDQISTELSAGRGPSMAYCYPDHVALYQKSGGVLDLDGYIESTATVTKADGTTEQVGLTQAQIDDYVPIYYNEGKIYGDTDGDGKDDMYTLPMLKSTELLFYNKTYFTANNLTVPTTWDEMEATCARILEIESAKSGGLEANPCIPLGYDSGANWFITMTEQLKSGYTSSEKGKYFLFNNEDNYDFVQRFTGWYKKGYVTTEEIFGSYTSDLFTTVDAASPKSYMCIGSSAGTTYQTPDKLADETYPFDVGVAMVPQANMENKKIISQGPSLCLFKKKNTQETAAAWLFTKFLTTSVEYQAKLSMNNGYNCAIQSVMENPVYAEFLESTDYEESLKAAAIKMTASCKDYFYVSPAFNGSSTARDDMATLMKNCFMQAPDPATNAAGAKTSIKGFFDETYDKLKKKYDK